MGNALINFAQGSSVGGAGFALIGTIGTLVVVSNGDDSNIVNWQFTVADVGVGSANAQGIVQNGGTPTYSFTPDVSGCYVVNLITTDNQGNQFQDTRVFGILETSGRLIPSYLGTDKAMNFVISLVENTKGWSPYLQAYLKAIDLVVAAGAPQYFTSSSMSFEVVPTSQNQEVFADTSSGDVPLSFPTTTSQLDGQSISVRRQSVDNVLSVSMTDSATIEDPQNPGTFVSTVFIINEPASYTWTLYKSASGGAKWCL